ncbi:hypothetical protein L6452_38603 [Arctium lappa]|uniref:Uncharacterized protein n=1 Tax=Arctium lappa TaxID=4217 RepID=A0ACB8XR52_ARCLA|nr:hypothetical protein L6452_38603 [Arctium lappa]
MSNQHLSMGSQSKPPVLLANEYQQWKKKLIQFLNHKSRDYMDSITSGPSNSSKEVWDELARQFVGSKASIQAKQNMCINAYEGFHAREGENLLDTYNRYNIILNDLRRNNISKSASEINYKFIKNLNPEWKNFTINLQMSKNMAIE